MASPLKLAPAPAKPQGPHHAHALSLDFVWPAHPYSMAFQPIVDLAHHRLIAYEALARGLHNQPAAEVFDQVPAVARPAMDQSCRVMAIDLAVSLGILATGADLCINTNPNAFHGSTAALERTIAAAKSRELPLNRIILEITEMEHLHDPDRLRSTLCQYRAQGLRTAIDDFGAGFAGLAMLAAYQPDILKIDIALTRDIHIRPISRTIVRGVTQICDDLNIQVIAEGVESEPQRDTLRHLGIHCMQGNLFAPPAFEALPAWPPR